jgi:ribokinase
VTAPSAGAAPAVVVLGDVMTDVGVRTLGPAARGSDTDASITVGGGGAGGNVSAWLAHLGVPVGLVTAVGADAAGDAVVGELRGRGVRVAARRDPDRPTGTVVALVDEAGERTMLTDRGANRTVTPADLPVGWFRAGAHLHVSGYALFAGPGRVAAVAALDRARRAGMSTSIDPASWAPLRRLGAARFLRLTAVARLCLPNLDEARELTGRRAADGAARDLASWYGAAVVTCGAGGAVWSDGTATVHERAGDVRVVDTTGAGDAFTAGWLEAAVGGTDPADALDRASAAAAAAAATAGARPPGSGALGV